MAQELMLVGSTCGTRGNLHTKVATSMTDAKGTSSSELSTRPLPIHVRRQGDAPPSELSVPTHPNLLAAFAVQPKLTYPPAPSSSTTAAEGTRRGLGSCLFRGERGRRRGEGLTGGLAF
uniref:Uncharacterized protein n=1 Tax=Setaria viridis TaxID=4556 RepID=A0A4U6W440_SETVI|nr:hypothetical protein SEVIR_1G036146v2 [Setaria viridis]